MASQITQLPDAPQRTDTQQDFTNKADAWVGAIDDWTDQVNVVTVEVESNANTALAQALAAATSATAAANSAALAQSTANVPLWVSGTTYNAGASVSSPANQQTYRRKTTGGGTTDPSLDTTNWSRLTNIAVTSRLSITSSTNLTQAHQGNVVDASGTFSITFAACSTLQDGWYVFIKNNGVGDITLDPNASETIDALTSFIMYPGEMRFVQCNGTNLVSYVLNPFCKEYLSSATWTKPPGYKYFTGENTGGGGGRSSDVFSYISTSNGAGGGGATVPFRFKSGDLSSTVSVQVAAGGVSGSGGGNTVFHTCTAYGGASGVAPNQGGGGGGTLSASVNSEGGAPTVGADLGSAYADASAGGGRAAVGTINVAKRSVNGGGGGGNNQSAFEAGGSSVHGGGGGTGASSDTQNLAGGVSTFAGNGGRGGFAIMRVAENGGADLGSVPANFSGSGVAANDLGLIFVNTAHASDATPSTPSGWTLVGTVSGGAGALGSNSGLRRATVFSKVMTGSETTVTLSNGSFTDSVVVSRLVKSVNGVTPTIVGFGTGSDNTAGTAWSVTTGSISVQPDDLIYLGSVINTATGATQTVTLTPTITMSGVTFTETLPSGHVFANSGNLSSSTEWTTRVNTGTTSAALTFATTYNTTTGNFPAGATIAVVLRGVDHLIDGQQPGGGCGGLGRKGGDGRCVIRGEL